MQQNIDEALLLNDLKDSAKKEYAFRSVVELYSKPLYTIIRRMVLNHEDADDILQNVFLKAWRSIDDFRGDSKLYTWLYRVTYYETLNFLRSKSRKSKYEVSLSEENQHLLDNLEADIYFDGDAAEKKFQKAVSKLSENQREVFLLRYYDEYSYKEISEMTGKLETTLKVNYHHAVKKIRKYLLEEE